MTYWGYYRNCVVCMKSFTRNRTDHYCCSKKCANKFSRHKKKNQNWLEEINQKYKPLEKKLLRDITNFGYMHGHIAVEQLLDILSAHTRDLNNEILNIRKRLNEI